MAKRLYIGQSNRCPLFIGVEKMRTAIYIRVSTEEQVREGYSISGQKQKLKSFCASQEWQVVGLYPDEGISAKDTNRPQLKRMIQDIKDDKIDCVLVYRLDRLTRSVFDLYKLLEVFEQHDCKFKSATEIYDTTSATGRMFITLVAAFAQFERENMGERISFGYAEKARQGKYPHPLSPFGYDLNKKESKLYINPVEAKTVRLIYDLYQKSGMVQVAKYLNDRKILTKKGNNWTDNTIMKILRNRIYRGDIEWVGEVIENTHEPIIDKDKWENTQELIKQRSTKPPRSVSSRYIFSGKLKCPGCGRTMTGAYTVSTYKGKDTMYLQYRCRHKRHSNCPGTKNVSEKKLEKAFIEYLENVSYEDIYDEVAATAEKNLNDHEQVDVESLKKQLDKIEKRKKKWQYAWADDLIEVEDFRQLMEEANKEEESIKEELSQAKKTEADYVNKEEIIESLKDVRKNWLFLDQLEKKNLVNQIVKRIHHEHAGNKVLISHIDFL